jgi:hypothetical protein
MTKPTSTRAMAGQNLIVASVNTALTRRLIALECELATQASFEFTLDGHPVGASSMTQALMKSQYTLSVARLSWATSSSNAQYSLNGADLVRPPSTVG